MQARAGLEAAKAAIAAEMPRRVPMLSVVDGAVDARVILGLEAAAEDDLAARPSHHDGEDEHEHNDFASVVIDLPEVTDIDALVASIQRLAREQNVLRAKGYIAVAGKPMRLLLQAVGERVRHQFDSPGARSPRQSKLVVIGEHGDIDEAAIRAGLGDLMHVVFRESRGLEETATPRDIGQDPADLVVLSFSDSDLAAFAAGWRRGRDSLPSLRLANLAELRHPLSVDTYIERTLSQARGILVRLIGGESYWSYGLTALHQLAKDRNIALAVLPADGRDDHASGCALDVAGLDAAAAQGALRQGRADRGAGGDRPARAGVGSLCGACRRRAWMFPRSASTIPHRGVCCASPTSDGKPRALVTFYRSYLTAADTAPGRRADRSAAAKRL